MTRKRMLRVVVYSTLGLIVLIVLVHPFTRQMLFGPKIEGMPLCYWQGGFRHWAAPDANRDSFTNKVFRWLGFAKPEEFVGFPEREENYLTLLLSLEDDPQPHVRERVAYSLGGPTTTEERTSALLRLLDDREARVRTAAAHSLGDSRPEVVAALPRLVELLDDGDMDCRIAAAWAAWRVGQKKHKKFVPILRQALKDPKATTRSEALRVVERMAKDADDAFPEIAVCATADPNPRVRQQAVKLLMAFGRPAIPFLVKALHDTDSSNAIGAAMGLRELGPEAKVAIPALQTLLRHSYEPIRVNALFALQRIDPTQFPALKAEQE